MSAANPQSIDRERERERLDENLNEALEETFPASDALALTRAPRDNGGATQAPAPASPRLETQQARQGVTGHGVRYVLSVGILLAIMAGVILYFIWWK